MKKLFNIMLAMLLALNLVGCGNTAEKEEKVDEGQKQEQVVQEEVELPEVEEVELPEVEEVEDVFAYHEFDTVDDVINAIKADLEEGGLVLHSDVKEDNGYVTNVGYLIEFEHDIDSDGFDWSSDDDYYIIYTIDNNTLELLSMQCDAMFVTNTEGISEQMKVVAETFTKYYGTVEAQEQLQTKWNPHRDMESIFITEGEGTTGNELALQLFVYTDTMEGAYCVEIW